MLQIERLLLQSRRPFIFIAVAFWWGGVVTPNLISLAFPEVLSPGAIPQHLNPDSEGTIVNVISAGALLTTTLLALANAVLRSRNFVSVSGWAVLGMTCAYLAWEELTDFHVVGVVPIRRAVFSDELFYSAGVYLWPVLASPLIAGFILTMGIFVHKGLCTREVRVLLVLGLAAWLLVIAHEVSFPFLFKGRAEVLANVLEESLEFGGALLIALSAATHLQQGRRPTRASTGPRLRMLAIGSLTTVGILGGLTVAFVFRAPVIDARADTHIGSFHIGLYDGESLAQEIYMPAAPISRFMVRLANDDPENRTAIVKLILKDLEHSDLVLREVQVEVPASQSPEWISVDFPPLVEPEGRLLAMQVVAELAPRAKLRVAAAKTSWNQRGQLWINGSRTWPDQGIEYMVYGASEPTLSKLRAIGRTLASDWRWPVLTGVFALALTFTMFIPTVLVAHCLPRKRTGPNLS